MYTNVEELKGKILENIVENGSESLEFHCCDGSVYSMLHEQDCCESVYLYDINGDLDDLIGSTLYMAESSSSDATGFNDNESGTWTFYKFATQKGYVTLRWLGESNGYYSEGVDFIRTKEPDLRIHRMNKLEKLNEKE